MPGALLRNTHMRFVCDRVRVRVETVDTPWTAGCDPGEELTLPVAHNEGNFFADAETLARLEDEERVVLRYLENPNGSANDIAGVCNEGRNVVGIMPHPERVSDPTLGSEEGLQDPALRARGGGGLNIQETYTSLGLSDFEYDRILELLGRAPNYLELSLFSAMWSEHCGYKNSSPLLKRFPSDGPAGRARARARTPAWSRWGTGGRVAFKMESHNHPSAVEPYEGAATGVGGIIRDILAMGARPVALLDSLRFGPLEEERNRYLFGEVVRGIGGYGNAVGVPTVGGEVSSRGPTPETRWSTRCAWVSIRTEDLMRSGATGEGNLVVLARLQDRARRHPRRDLRLGRAQRRVGVQEVQRAGRRPVLREDAHRVLFEAAGWGSARLVAGPRGRRHHVLASEMAAKGGVGIEIETDKVPMREGGMEP